MIKEKIKDILIRLRIYLIFPLILYLGVELIKYIKQGTLFSEIPLLLIFIGAIFNALVICSNDFKMPVRLFPHEEYKINSPAHFPYRNPDNIKFQSFSDKYLFVFGFPGKRKQFLKGFKSSIGDIFIVIGFLALLLKGG